LREDGLDLAGPTPAGLRQQCTKGLGAGHLAGLKTERPRSHPLGPGVQRGVCRGPLAIQQVPRHPAQTPVSPRVGRALELDHHQPVGLVRQDIARQHPPAALARRAARQGQEDRQLVRPPFAVGVLPQNDQTSLDLGHAQRQRPRPLAWAALSHRKLETAFPKQSLVGTVRDINRDRHGNSCRWQWRDGSYPSLHNFSIEADRSRYPGAEAEREYRAVSFFLSPSLSAMSPRAACS